MVQVNTIIEGILGFFLVAFSLGVILAKKPVYASLSFLMTLLLLASLYLQLSSEFIAVMQILIYAGAILVIFMFVIILFQDAHQQIDRYKPKSLSLLLWVAGGSLLLAFLELGRRLLGIWSAEDISPKFGSVESLGQVLYIDFFFPFEAVILLFLIAVVGALYIGRKVT